MNSPLKIHIYTLLFNSFKIKRLLFLLLLLFYSKKFHKNTNFLLSFWFYVIKYFFVRIRERKTNRGWTFLFLFIQKLKRTKIKLKKNENFILFEVERAKKVEIFTFSFK